MTIPRRPGDNNKIYITSSLERENFSTPDGNNEQSIGYVWTTPQCIVYFPPATNAGGIPGKTFNLCHVQPPRLAYVAKKGERETAVSTSQPFRLVNRPFSKVRQSLPRE